MVRDKDKPMFGRLFQLASLLSVFFSFVGSLGFDIYLASSQWLLVAIVFSCWGIYLHLEAEFRSA